MRMGVSPKATRDIIAGARLVAAMEGVPVGSLGIRAQFSPMMRTGVFRVDEHNKLRGDVFVRRPPVEAFGRKKD